MRRWHPPCRSKRSRGRHLEIHVSRWSLLSTCWFSPSTSRLSTWLTENESENFSPAYLPACSERVRVILPEFFCVRCRFLPEVPVLASIPAAAADRLDDTAVVDVVKKTAARLVSVDASWECINLTSCGLGGIRFHVESPIHILHDTILLVPASKIFQWMPNRALPPLHFNNRKYGLPADGPRGQPLSGPVDELRD